MGRPYQFIYYCPSEIDHQPETIETYPDSLELSNIAQIISGSMSRETTETYPDSVIPQCSMRKVVKIVNITYFFYIYVELI
jgi:hypothetical protein